MNNLFVIKSNVIKKLPDLNIPTKNGIWEDCFIAGSFVWKNYFREPINKSTDIDFFFTKESAYKKFVNSNVHKLKLSFTCDTVDSFMSMEGNQITVQAVKIFRDSIDDCFNNFDFHHCCFAYDGRYYIFTDKALECIESKELKINYINPGKELKSLERAFKYKSQGFAIPFETWEQLLLGAMTSIHENKEKLDNTYNIIKKINQDYFSDKIECNMKNKKKEKVVPHRISSLVLHQDITQVPY